MYPIKPHEQPIRLYRACYHWLTWRWAWRKYHKRMVIKHILAEIHARPNPPKDWDLEYVNRMIKTVGAGKAAWSILWHGISREMTGQDKGESL